MSKPIYIGQIDQLIYISTVPIDHEDWEREHVLVAPAAEPGVKVLEPSFHLNILYNVLNNSGANRVIREF